MILISVPMLFGVCITAYVLAAVLCWLDELLVGAFLEWRYWSFVAKERGIS